MSESSSKNLRAKLYSTDWCIKCKNIKRALDALGVDYDVVDVEKHPDESITELPVFEYNSCRYTGELSLSRLKEIVKG